MRSSSRNRRSALSRRAGDLGPLTDAEARWLRRLLADAERVLGPEIPETLRAYPPLEGMLDRLAVARRALAAYDQADARAPRTRSDLGGVYGWAREMLELGRTVRRRGHERLRHR